MVEFVLFIKKLFHVPQFFFLLCGDYIKWCRCKGWLDFDKWGLHLYVGKFGSGKTCSVVHDAYKIAKAFPQVTIISNFALLNFPSHSKILPLTTVDDILNAPQNSLVLIDEIGTIFNSRDFLGKKGVPKLLFQHICQVRKRNVQILATTQRWNFLDKQLRDITATVTVNRVSFSHPFSRLVSCICYDSVDYDLAFNNPAYKPLPLGTNVYCQTDKLRNSYDTSELVETLMASDYLSDSEISANRGDSVRDISEISRRNNRAIRYSKAK
ncbi:MAG: zonular occludens toxin domain-containing protein [Hydrogenoanaerobacterium sp.]